MRAVIWSVFAFIFIQCVRTAPGIPEKSVGGCADGIVGCLFDACNGILPRGKAGSVVVSNVSGETACTVGAVISRNHSERSRSFLLCGLSELDDVHDIRARTGEFCFIPCGLELNDGKRRQDSNDGDGDQ